VIGHRRGKRHIEKPGLARTGLDALAPVAVDLAREIDLPADVWILCLASACPRRSGGVQRGILIERHVLVA
jgi:hypothetical protein